MQKKSKKVVILAVASLLLAGFGALVAHNYKTKTSFKYETQNPAEIKPEQHPQDSVSAAINEDAAKLEEARKNSNLLKVDSNDFVLGDENAPITIIEYASLSCPHCAAFARESFEKLKTDYIDSKKVKFVFRNFPLNQAALTAAMFATCQSQDEKLQATEKYYFTVKALFKTQDSWAFDEKYIDKLEAIAKIDGMSSERFKSCVSNKELQEKFLTQRIEVSKVLQLKSAPTFFINGEISEGYVDYETIKRLIEKKLKEVKK
jgi:protein-disulfide isomerase